MNATRPHERRAPVRSRPVRVGSAALAALCSVGALWATGAWAYILLSAWSPGCLVPGTDAIDVAITLGFAAGPALCWPAIISWLRIAAGRPILRGRSWLATAAVFATLSVVQIGSAVVQSPNSGAATPARCYEGDISAIVPGDTSFATVTAARLLA